MKWELFALEMWGDNPGKIATTFPIQKGQPMKPLTKECFWHAESKSLLVLTELLQFILN